MIFFRFFWCSCVCVCVQGLETFHGLEVKSFYRQNKRKMSSNRLKCAYENRSSGFYHKSTNQDFKKQFCHIYASRLQQLGELLKQKAQKQFGKICIYINFGYFWFLNFQGQSINSRRSQSSAKTLLKPASSSGLSSKIRHWNQVFLKKYLKIISWCRCLLVLTTMMNKIS